MRSYEDFLSSKRRHTAPSGIRIDADQLHPCLFHFQRHLTQFALSKGRAALFCDTGTGKTVMQVEWAHQLAQPTLIVAPLAVAQQTIREAQNLLDVEVTYARDQDDVRSLIAITNYERLERFDPGAFGAVVLDESSILKSFDGKMRQQIVSMFSRTRFRLACTATPAPNDEVELTSHAEFVGAAGRAEMLAAYFVHDDEGWRLKGHAVEPMYHWMASWAAALRRPSDLGYPDDGYILPPLRIVPQIVAAHVEQDGQLFATDLGGVGGRARVRRETLAARVERAVELAYSDKEQWLVWCGLNAESDALTREIDGAVNVEGAMSPEAKADAIHAFQRGEIRVLVTKPAICGFGLNLQNCAHMVFVGLSDSYEAYYQAIRRCWRYGQTRPVEAHVVVSELEQQIVDNVRQKEQQASRMTEALVRHMNRRREAA